MRLNYLIVYRKLSEDEMLLDMTYIMEHYKNKDAYDSVMQALHKLVYNLLSEAGENGFYGNLWHCHLAHLMVNDENAYSMACEIRGNCEGTINEAVLHDFRILREFFAYDFGEMERFLKLESLKMVLDYHGNTSKSGVYNMRIRDRICTLAKNLEESTDETEMKAAVTAFYGDFGVGRFGLHKSFRIQHDASGVSVVPILNIAHVYLEDLIGYESQKAKLIENTEAFVEGRVANNCLLFGDAGTGKSSAIKGIINRYYDKGLRIIEVYKHQFCDLNDVIARIKNRNYRFILYMDDLSFEEFETEYKYLKAVIEGGLEKKPENVLIYATSNRRHLIKETTQDKADYQEDLHRNDTVQEKMSLVARFGVTIYFPSPQKKEFEQIVLGLAERSHIDMPEEELLLLANQWELNHTGKSGRVARQFIDHLCGKKED